MDDALLVCVLDGVTDLREQFQPFVGGKIILVALVRDFNAAHQLHDEVRPARLSRAGIENFRDVRMIHQRQRLPLRLESGDDRLGIHAELDDLERHAAANGFELLGHVNHAATALADLLEELGDVQAKTHWQKAHDILAGMVQAGLHVSAQDLSFLQHLRTKIGG